MSLVQGLYKYYDPQGVIKTMSVIFLSISYIKLTYDFNFQDICRWYDGIWLWAGLIEHLVIHQ